LLTEVEPDPTERDFAEAQGLLDKIDRAVP